MFPLTLDGLRDAVDVLRRGQAAAPLPVAGGGRR